MRLFVLIALFYAVTCSQAKDEYDLSITEEEKAYHRNKATKFKEHLFPFNERIALEANYYSKGHFIISAHSIWYNLGTLQGEQQELFSTLNLPDQDSLRRQFYGLALSMEGDGKNIKFSRSWATAVDETVGIKKDWRTYTDIPPGMPDYLKSATLNKPFGRVQKYIMSHQRNVPYSSHTVLFDHLMFDGLWSAAFSERAVQEGPFFDMQGKSIGTVEYLRMKGKLRVVRSLTNNIKFVEVPLDSEGQHTMLLAVGNTGESMIKEVFSGDIFSDLKLVEEPIDVAVPKLLVSSGLDLGPSFNKNKHSKETSEPSVTRNPGLPGYYQMVSVNITDSVGRNKCLELTDLSNEADLASLEKNGFIANRPFLFALFVPLQQTDIRVPVFTGVYSYPGKRGEQKIFD